MPTQISTVIAVSDPPAAVEFYSARSAPSCCGRLVIRPTSPGCRSMARTFSLARENPPSTRSPERAGHTTVRIELFADDPQAVYERAVAAGATPGNPVIEHTHETTGGNPSLRMLQGGVVDPFGHIWLIGKFLE